jgi:4-oxalocrotonate tautomerase
VLTGQRAGLAGGGHAAHNRAMPGHGPRDQKTLYTASNKRSRDMPEIYVHAVEGRTVEQKRALVRDITVAVVKHFDVPPQSVMVQIVESSKENKAKGGVLFSER